MNVNLRTVRRALHSRYGVTIVVAVLFSVVVMDASFLVQTPEWTATVTRVRVFTQGKKLQANALIRRLRRSAGKGRVTLFATAVPRAFPAFGKAMFPVDRVPNWGAMTSPVQWNRTYEEMGQSDFVPVPAYDLSVLTRPLVQVQQRKTSEDLAALTAKLFYSTRYFGAYDLDAGEFSGQHPGVDLKLAEGTPVGAIGGGRVDEVSGTGALGLHIIVEHRVGSEKFFSVYGHLQTAAVKAGDDVQSGQVLGAVGMTGSTTGPHLHLQVDRDQGDALHHAYAPLVNATQAEVGRWAVNPITFIQEHGVSW